MRLSRRAFSTWLLALGGGCLGSRSASTPTARPDRDGDGVPDGGDDYPDDAGRAFREFRVSGGTTTLEAGEFSAVALTNSPRASGDVLHYEVSVVGAGAVDCVVFERDAYDAYEEGARDVPTVSEYSREGVGEASVTATLDRGEYIFALDCTGLLTEPGRESVEVEFVLDIAEPANPARGDGSAETDDG